MNEDVFTKPPPYGRITDWLGPEMLQRLLDFAQKQRDSFFQTTVGYTEENRRVDLNVRRSSRIIALGSLKEELQTNLRAILPAMFQRLGAEPFEPSKFEVEMVAHGDGALFTEHRDTAIESEDSLRVRSSLPSGSSVPSITFTGFRNRSQAVFCGFIPSSAATNLTPLSKSSLPMTGWCSFPPGSRMKFCRWSVHPAGSRIPDLQSISGSTAEAAVTPPDPARFRASAGALDGSQKTAHKKLQSPQPITTTTRRTCAGC
jgi:hypothetical protein